MEPELFFGNRNQSIDPRIGLINYGPYGAFTESRQIPLVIKAGMIGTSKSKRSLEAWLEKLKFRIAGKENEHTGQRGVDFPGMSFDSPLKFEISLDKNCIQLINESEIRNLEKLDKKDRIDTLVKIYEQKFKDLDTTTDPHPQIVFLPLSQLAIDLCKDPHTKNERILYQRRNEKSEHDIPLFDFHNAIKVIAYKNGNFISQIVRPSTMNFTRIKQDAATIAWNFAVATYYKATGIPWKLANLDEETCYIGISFYHEIRKGKDNIRTSMAHVYLSTGESQVIRGSPFKWDQRNNRTPSLTSELAQAVIEDVLDLYKRQRRGLLPRRVVIHKTSPFSDSEVEGFDNALVDVEAADYIHILEHPGIRLFSKSSDYPPIRGTFMYSGSRFLLYTTGYVPLLGTYMGSTIPSPLYLQAFRMDSEPEEIGKDILALTKLDWNNADFNTNLPVTISVSRKVGEILSETTAQELDNFPTNYRYYM